MERRHLMSIQVTFILVQKFILYKNNYDGTLVNRKILVFIIQNTWIISCDKT